MIAVGYFLFCLFALPLNFILNLSEDFTEFAKISIEEMVNNVNTSVSPFRLLITL